MFNLKNFLIFSSIIIIFLLVMYPIIIIFILCLFFIIEFSIFSYIYSSVNKNFDIEIEDKIKCTN